LSKQNNMDGSQKGKEVLSVVLIFGHKGDIDMGYLKMV